MDCLRDAENTYRRRFVKGYGGFCLKVPGMAMPKTILVALGLMLGAAACSGPKPLPTGPPPEYEDEPPPSGAPGATDAGAPDALLGSDR